MSWPATRIDWLELTPRLRDGDLVCVTHGLVDAESAAGGLPVCPHCRQMLSRANRDRDGVLRGFAEVTPVYCAGPDRHRLTAGHVTVGWAACQCTNAEPGPGGHRSWSCRECDPPSVVVWPPHAA
jgi:hypothetical protein